MPAIQDINYDGLPEHMRHGMQTYIEAHEEPGGFLMAVLENDFMEACGRADEENLMRLHDYAIFLYNKVPATCWGSKEKVKAWLERGRDESQGS